MAPGSALWVKLADFGTADVDERGLGAPVGLDHFTTLENSPIEQLVLGSGATQGYAADCWSLGLSLLHLFTGYAPVSFRCGIGRTVWYQTNACPNTDPALAQH